MSAKPFLGILLAILASAVLPPRPVEAAAITVTTTVDELNTDGDCSLREAVRAANTNVAVDACAAGQGDQTDTITVPAGTYTLTLAGSDNDAAVGDLDLRDNPAVDDALDDLVITGAGAATTIIQACAVEQFAGDCPAGQGIADRVLKVIDARVAISGVTIRHGRAPNLGNKRYGSGIALRRFSTPSALTLTDVVVTKNGSSVFDGAVFEGGGIYNEYSELTLTRVTVSDNAANEGRGAVSNEFAPAVLVMTDSTVSGNSARGINNGPFVTATLTGCTISGNGDTGVVAGGTTTITNSTISGNVSSFGGAGIIAGGTLDLRSSTVTLNHRINGPSGNGAGGIAGGAVLRNTIVAGNISDSPAFNPPDCATNSTLFVSEGFNLVGDGSGCLGLVDGTNGDQIGTKAAPIDAKLGPLADNDGPTLTHAWLPGSPTIDAGNPAAPGSGGTACPATDQRGETRPRGAFCDIGAVELGDVGALAVDAVKPAVGGNSGTVLARIYGRAFAAGAEVRLVRTGFADVIGTRVGAPQSVIAASLDLRGVAPGLWSVQVRNPDASVATLPDAFTVAAGGGADLWVDIVVPRGIFPGRTQSIYVTFGNRGTIDAYGVPLWFSIPEELTFHIPFPVSPPPSQPDQVPTDWTRIAIDEPIPPPEDRDSFTLVLPVVPAGSTGTLRFRVTGPPDSGVTPGRLPFQVTADIGTPYFQPDLADEVVAGFVARAKELAADDQATPGVPSDAAIAAYVRTQLAGIVASAIVNPDGGGYPPVYSRSQLIVDTAYFIAVASAPALALEPARQWLAGLFDDLVGRSAEARIVDPDCPPGDVLCERDDEEVKPCPFPGLCCPIPGILCMKELPPSRPKCGVKYQLNHLEWYTEPCTPERERDDVPFRRSSDPNDKVGPGGPGGFIDGVTPLPYAINFENLATATGEAFEVTVTDQLDVTKYDLATFSLGPISFGDRLVPVPPGLQSFSTEVDLRPGVNILVGIDAALDTGTGIISWKFTTLDPATHEFPEDPEFGFLPPNVTPPEGEGAVLFTVRLKPGFGLGTTVCNDARIVFDVNAPIDTPEFCNTIGAPEDCENCIDDDGDTLVDRADPDCAPAANGAGVGVGDATAGKAVDKCAKAVRKVGTKLVTTRLKQLGACEKAVADCVQLKPGDAACLAKAQAKCTKARTALDGAEVKLTAAVVKTCGEPAVTAAHLRAAVGLGFDGTCAGLGDGSGTVADVAECIREGQQCAAERILGTAVPRARELLVVGGFDPVTRFRCLDAGALGGGSAIAADKRKAIRKCDATIQKAAAKLTAGRAKAGEACGAAVFTCLQTKPADPACVGKAGGTCSKAIAGMPKLEAGFATTIAKTCGASPLVAADLLTSDGLGASALAARCARLGVASLATVADVTACLEKQLTCHVDHLLETTTPRLGELLDLGGVTLP